MSRSDEAMESLRAALLESYRQSKNADDAGWMTEQALSITLNTFAGLTIYFPKIDTTVTRNAQILSEREAGRTLEAIAELVHLTPKQVGRILKHCA